MGQVKCRPNQRSTTVQCNQPKERKRKGIKEQKVGAREGERNRIKWERTPKDIAINNNTVVTYLLLAL